jgi:hypothetical protein
MVFELWNHVSGNAVGEFETVEAALMVVRAELAAHGRGYVAEWTLVVADDDQTQPIAAGDALIALAGGAHRADTPTLV